MFFDILIKKPIEHKIIKNNIFIIYENNDLVNKLNLKNYIIYLKIHQKIINMNQIKLVIYQMKTLMNIII